MRNLVYTGNLEAYLIMRILRTAAVGFLNFSFLGLLSQWRHLDVPVPEMSSLQFKKYKLQDFFLPVCLQILFLYLR